ncbi:MAG: preprotein translocase subunit SecE [Candidatus Magasanikbacteria bacterium]|nr:preprotein translocase subunit SecE [Candidatus Magasanikbacteria bacterium]|tara:strand:+ start:681 stop:869 length:189 start_codon:yes stop_codon:yes gene_type:complete
MKALLSLRSYIQESIGELKKVTWPTKQQVVQYSIIVVAMSLGVAIFFGILDFFLKSGLAAIL